jgi:hypothetical protein
MLSRAQGAAEAGEGRAGVGREEVGTSQVVLGQPTWEKVGERKKRKSLEGYDCVYVSTCRGKKTCLRVHMPLHPCGGTPYRGAAKSLGRTR